MTDQPKGVVAVLTGPDGHVWASVSDFDRSGYGGYSLQEAQELRAKRALAWEFIRKTCSQVVVEVIESHWCEEIVSDLCRKKGFTRTILPIGHEEDSGARRSP